MSCQVNGSHLVNQTLFLTLIVLNYTKAINPNIPKIDAPSQHHSVKYRLRNRDFLSRSQQAAGFGKCILIIFGGQKCRCLAPDIAQGNINLAFWQGHDAIISHINDFQILWYFLGVLPFPSPATRKVIDRGMRGSTYRDPRLDRFEIDSIPR